MVADIRRRTRLAACSGLAVVAALALPCARAASTIEEVRVVAPRLDASQPGSHALTRVLPEQASDSLPLLPSDLLRGVPGAFAQQTTPGQGSPIVRGLKGSQVLHLVDGFRLNNALFRSAPNQYLALVPTAALAAVDVARGPVGTLYGSDAMGGVVHLHSRQPEFDRELTIGGRLAWAGNRRATSATLAVAHGGTEQAVELGVTVDDVGDRRIAGDTRVSPSDYRSRGAWLRTRHRGQAGEWGLNAQFVEQPETPRVDELLPGFEQVAPASSEFSFEPNEREFVQLRAAPALRSRLADELQLQLGWQRVTDDRRTRALDSRLRIRERNNSELYGLSATAARGEGSAHHLRYGFDLYRDEVRSRRWRESLIDDAVEPVAPRFPDGSRIDSAAAFVDWRWRIDDRGQLEAGVRYSRFDIEIAANGFGAPPKSLATDDLTARIGLRWRLNADLSLLAAVGQGFRAPNVFDLSTLGPRPGNRFNTASPSLGPERVTGYDLGLSLQRGGLELDLGLFYSDFRDKITSVLTGETTDDGRLVVASRNLGRMRLYGAEFAARADLPADWTVDGSLSWTWGEERSPARTTAADRIPPVNGLLRVARPAGDWRFEALALFALEQDRLSPRDLRDPRIDPQGTPGWVSVNLRAERELGAQLQLGVAVENLFDEAYREHGSGIDAPGRGIVVDLSRPL